MNRLYHSLLLAGVFGVSLTSCTRARKITSGADLPAPVGSTPAEMRFEPQVRNEDQKRKKMGSMVVELRILPLLPFPGKPGVLPAPARPKGGVIALLKDSSGAIKKRFEASRLDTILVIDSLRQGVHRVFITAGASNGAEIHVPIDGGCRTAVSLYVEQAILGVRVRIRGAIEPPGGQHTITRCTQAR